MIAITKSLTKDKIDKYILALIFVQYIEDITWLREYIEVTSWLVSADDFSSRVARGANERVSAANE